MKILFTICGRAGSKGIRNKNTRNFMDKPLPLYTLSTIDLLLKENKEIEADIIVNTDSAELAEILTSWNKRPVEYISRKLKLAGDSVGKLDVIRDSAKQKDKSYDMIIDLDITSPLRNKVDLQNLINKMKTSKYDVVFSVTTARRNPYFNMVKMVGEYYDRVIESPFVSRQQAPAMYDMNASMYAFSPKFLAQEKNNIFEGKCGVIEMKDTGVLDLDHESDFELMEVIGEYLIKRDKLFREVYININI